MKLRGLRPVVVPARTGRALDVPAAESTIVRALAGFGRAPVGLPVRVETPDVTAATLRPVLAKVDLALSAPVRLTPRRDALAAAPVADRRAARAARPTAARTLAIGGPAAERWLDGLAARVDRPPTDADFTGNEDGSASVIPAQPGVELDRAATSTALLAAATSRTKRLAEAAVVESQPEFTTAEAEALGITSRPRELLDAVLRDGRTGSRNLLLAVKLLDGARIAPGATFSFNGRVGERTEERGFRSAPVIIGGEYEEGVGRRRLAGRDDHVQRRVGGRAADPGARAARALHRALSSSAATPRSTTRTST